MDPRCLWMSLAVRSATESSSEVTEGSMVPRYTTSVAKETMEMSMSSLPRSLEWDPVILTSSLRLVLAMKVRRSRSPQPSPDRRVRCQ
jgi:hypothetical protein